METWLLAAYPVLLVFGAIFSVLRPEIRAAPYDPITQSHSQESHLSPSYFARKDNVFNTFFVKRGWAWFTVAFFIFVFTHPAMAAAQRRTQAVFRWAIVTTWWILITQWCFGPPIIDRSFRYTGGKCADLEQKADAGEADPLEYVTAAACKSAGGKWRGGHDISGHVFLLVLGSFFLLQEIGWVVQRWRAEKRDERTIVMHDGAVKSAEVEADRRDGAPGGGASGVGVGAKFAGTVVAMSWWMILMTAVYFHTWFEKLTGLVVALTGLYSVYFLPRVVPALRNAIGLPGI